MIPSLLLFAVLAALSAGKVYEGEDRVFQDDYGFDGQDGGEGDADYDDELPPPKPALFDKATEETGNAHGYNFHEGWAAYAAHLEERDEPVEPEGFSAENSMQELAEEHQEGFSMLMNALKAGYDSGDYQDQMPSASDSDDKDIKDNSKDATIHGKPNCDKQSAEEPCNKRHGCNWDTDDKKCVDQPMVLMRKCEDPKSQTNLECLELGDKCIWEGGEEVDAKGTCKTNPEGTGYSYSSGFTGGMISGLEGMKCDPAARWIKPYEMIGLGGKYIDYCVVVFGVELCFYSKAYLKFGLDPPCCYAELKSNLSFTLGAEIWVEELGRYINVSYVIWAAPSVDVDMQRIKIKGGMSGAGNSVTIILVLTRYYSGCSCADFAWWIATVSVNFNVQGVGITIGLTPWPIEVIIPQSLITFLEDTFGC